MTITVTVESSPSQFFEQGDRYEMADFMTWVADGSVPDGLLLRDGERYYMVDGRRLTRCDANGQVTDPPRGRPGRKTDTWKWILRALADAMDGEITPSYRDLADVAGVSLGSVSYHLQRMERLGLVVRGDGAHRSTLIAPRGVRTAERLAVE
jgi:DNA-binding transcriptional ArsR family regulator